MEAMTYTTQNLWTWWFAVYLFFGGMGAAACTVSIVTDLYVKPHRNLAMWGTVGGTLMLLAGSGLLFFHLMDQLAVIYLLNPIAIVNNPSAWIAWGTQFIVVVQLASVLYALPYMLEAPFFKGLPLIGSVLEMGIIKSLADFSTRNRKVVGWVAALAGFGTAFYTGLLLQSFPAVALWHNSGVPVLFTVSAFSTAFAFLIFVLYKFIPSEDDHALLASYEKADAILIVAELMILFAIFNFTLTGSEGGALSSEMLWNDAGWLFGFIGLGLIVPLLIELKGITKGWDGHGPIVLASVLVMGGGYVLRHYFMMAGVYVFPW